MVRRKHGNKDLFALMVLVAFAAAGCGATEGGGGVASASSEDTTAGLDGEDTAGADEGTGGDATGSDSESADDSSADDGSDDRSEADSSSETEGGGDCARSVVVDTPAALRDALVNAAPGDCIEVAPGDYAAPDVQLLTYAGEPRQVYYYSQASGTSDQPIVLESQEPQNPAQLQGLSTADSAYILWINGSNWVVRDLVLRTGGKGLMLDEASDSWVRGVQVYEVGDEGIHLRSGTSNTLVEDCVVDGTGLQQPGFGEGIYIGSDHSQWGLYESSCDNNTIRGCTIRNTGAESVDVKEGTTLNVIEECELYGGGISGVNYADSFIDLKGDAARVRNNSLYKEGNGTVTRGVAIVERPQGPTATNNWISNNSFYMDDENGLMVHAYAGSDNYAWDNVREPEGEEYQGNAPELYLTEPP